MTPVPSGPELIHFMLESQCNARCIICPQHLERQAGTWNKQMRLSPDDVGTALDAYSYSVKRVNLSGLGEPMMHPEFERITRLVTDRAPPGGWNEVNTVTNGSLIGRGGLGPLLECPGYLTVSIDAPERALFESIRQGLSFRDVTAGLGYLACMPRHPERKIGVGMVVIRRNVDAIYSTICLAHELGADYIMVSRGGSLDTAEAEAHMEIPRWDARMLEQIAQAQEKFPEGAGEISIYNYCNEERPSWAHCMAPWRELVVGHDGRIHPCYCAYDTHPIDLGHLTGEDPWCSAKMNRLRAQLSDRVVDVVEFGLCVACYKR